ncbi:basic salivary proline-rich protein 3-like [Meriones unguiculatus]|uniref:basic salivary proline-rich protein 3-like n=1 Tax=Meriones unguiculatus TaxID=10047 RepID=UPI00293F48A0|nr:basic salivary proline-rich protein 3-like [Meriones unguiculatus]
MRALLEEKLGFGNGRVLAQHEPHKLRVVKTPDPSPRGAEARGEETQGLASQLCTTRPDQLPRGSSPSARPYTDDTPRHTSQPGDRPQPASSGDGGAGSCLSCQMAPPRHASDSRGLMRKCQARVGLPPARGRPGLRGRGKARAQVCPLGAWRRLRAPGGEGPRSEAGRLVTRPCKRAVTQPGGAGGSVGSGGAAASVLSSVHAGDPHQNPGPSRPPLPLFPSSPPTHDLCIAAFSPPGSAFRVGAMLSQQHPPSATLPPRPCSPPHGHTPHPKAMGLFTGVPSQWTPVLWKETPP